MSLLILDPNIETIITAQKIFDVQFEKDVKMSTEYDEKRKSLMLRDISYNLECLNVALEFNSEDIFNDYALWICKLLDSRMPDLQKLRIKTHMVDHYKYISSVLKETMNGQKLDFAEKLLSNAIKITEAEIDSPSNLSRMEIGNHIELRKSFLSAILAGDKRRALFIIKVAVESKVPLNEIYIDVFQEAMFEVGNLWQKNVITVDKEHVCTAITQMVMSDLANEISSTPRIGKSILACCVGDELHDMGIRILCDIFELAGWDSHYIGASVPSENIINSIIENKPDLLALSVTMPHHLKICSTVIKDIRNNPNTKDVKIAVGGRAVSLTQNIESVWDVEVATKSAPELLNWATREFNIGETEVL